MIEQLREAGYRVEVRHVRCATLQREEWLDEGLDARDVVGEMLHPADERLRSFPVSPQGGATLVRIIPPGPDGPVPAAAVEGRAVCRLTENFSRKLGRQIALGRAVTEARARGFAL